jgi:hypothetical protein
MNNKYDSNMMISLEKVIGYINEWNDIYITYTSDSYELAKSIYDFLSLKGMIVIISNHSNSNSNTDSNNSDNNNSNNSNSNNSNTNNNDSNTNSDSNKKCQELLNRSRMVIGVIDNKYIEYAYTESDSNNNTNSDTKSDSKSDTKSDSKSDRNILRNELTVIENIIMKSDRKLPCLGVVNGPYVMDHHRYYYYYYYYYYN